MSLATRLFDFHLFPASLHGQADLPGNHFEPFLQQTVQSLAVNWRDNLILLAAVALVIALTFAALLWLRKIRRPNGETLHRSPWPASAGKNRPNPTPLLATGTFRQRRRRRRARQPH